MGTYLYRPLILSGFFYRNSEVSRGFSICILIINNDEEFMSLCLLPTWKHEKIFLYAIQHISVPYGSKNKELLFTCAVLSESSLLARDKFSVRGWNLIIFNVSFSINVIIRSKRSLDQIKSIWWARYISRYSDWLRSGRSGDRIPVGARFSAPVHTGPRAHLVSCTMGTGSFPGLESGRSVTLTPHPF